jgi:DnaJ-class molecular chaperone
MEISLKERCKMEKKICSRCKGMGVLNVGTPFKVGSELGIDYSCSKCFGSGYELTNDDKYYHTKMVKDVLKDMKNWSE